jgi:hypothetical protein
MATASVPGPRTGICPYFGQSSGLILKKYRLFNAENNFKVIYPDAKHYFSAEAREEAYRFMDRALKNSENNVNVR